MKTYLYRCFDRDGQLLYVGIAADWEKRRKQHAKEKHWWPDVVKCTTMAFETRREALWAEWAVITTCHPVYNKAASVPAAPAETLPPEVFSDELDMPTLTFLGAVALNVRRIGRAIHWWFAGDDHPASEPVRRTGTKIRRTVPTGPLLPEVAPPIPWSPAIAYPETADTSESSWYEVPVTLAILDREDDEVEAEESAPFLARVLVLRAIKEAGFQGVPPGTIQAFLKAEKIDATIGQVRGWVRELLDDGEVIKTAWDTIVVAPAPRDGEQGEPDSPVGV